MNVLHLPYIVRNVANQGNTLGGDASKWQQLMDWAKAKSGGWRFSFIRTGSITYDEPGTCYTDFQFERNAEMSPEYMFTGGYWYFRPAWSATRQAEYVSEKIYGKNLLLPFVLDAENNDTKMANYYVEKQLKSFADRLYENTRKQCMIYTSQGWWTWPNIYAYDGCPDWAAAKDLWVANYTVYPKPAIPVTWASKGWKFWQYTDKGDGLKYGVPRDPGAPPPSVDLNWFNGTYLDLEHYVNEHNNGGIITPPPSHSPSPSPSAPPAPPQNGFTQMEVMVDNLNVRTGPGTNYPAVGGLHKDDIVEVHDVAGTSAWVQMEDGTWAASQYNNTKYMTPIT